MSDERNNDDWNELSIPDKIQRVQDLWDDIARSSATVDPTAAQLAESERRLRLHEANPGPYASWEEIRKKLENGR